MLWWSLYLSSIYDSVSSFVSVSVGSSFKFLVADKVFVHSASNSCFIRYYLIVFTKHHFVAIQTFVRKKKVLLFSKTNFDYVEF